MIMNHLGLEMGMFYCTCSLKYDLPHHPKQDPQMTYIVVLMLEELCKGKGKDIGKTSVILYIDYSVGHFSLLKDIELSSQWNIVCEGMFVAI